MEIEEEWKGGRSFSRILVSRSIVGNCIRVVRCRATNTKSENRDDLSGTIGVEVGKNENKKKSEEEKKRREFHGVEDGVSDSSWDGLSKGKFCGR